MESLTVALALALVWTGLAAVVAHLAATAYLVLVRPRPPALEHVHVEAVPWGFLGVGLVTGVVCYLLARGLVGDGWGIGSQPQAVVVVLVIVAWGYGAAYEWADSWVRVTGGWVAPLVLSGLTGLCLGAIPTFG